MADAMYIHLLSKDFTPLLAVSKPHYQRCDADLRALCARGGGKSMQSIYEGTLVHVVNGLEILLVVAFREQANAVWAAEFVGCVQYFLLNLAGSRNELRLELLNRRFLEVYTGLEDMLHSLDPYSRSKPPDDAVFNFPLESQLWALPPSTRSVVVKSSLGKGSFQGLADRMRDMAEVERVSLPAEVTEKGEARYVKHPFASQFTANLPAEKPSASVTIKKTPVEASVSVAQSGGGTNVGGGNTAEVKKQGEKKERETIDLATLGKCRLAIMVLSTQEKVLVAFQDNKIRNMKIVGQVGLELSANATYAAGVHTVFEMDPLWSDPKKVEKRPCSGFVEQIGPIAYDVSLSHITKSSALLEYIVSPLTINLSRFPLLAHYVASPILSNSFRLEIHYKVNSEWPQPLTDVTVTATLTDYKAEIKDESLGMAVSNGVIEWKTGHLTPGQKGVLECSVSVTTYTRHPSTGLSLAPMDHIKVAFKCVVRLRQDCNISDIDGAVKTREKDVVAVRRLMVELVVSPNS